MNNSIYPCLWFDGKAKEAAEFYCDVFINSKLSADTPLVVMIESNGQKIMCLNGGPHFKLNPSISFFVVCETEKETDEVWAKLTDEGSVLIPLDKYEWSDKYGWVQDRFGVSWQLSFGKMEDVGQKFTPSFLFTDEQCGKTEEAVKFYTSVFKNSSVTGILKYGAGEDDKEGLVKHAMFTLDEYVFMAMDSSVQNKFNFNEAFSIVVTCDTQDEIDYYWNKLTEDGMESMCGWLKDKFGVSWQIVPSVLEKLMSDPDKSQNVLNAFLKMKKFDIEKLLNA
ncbi:MAG: VOC family protein [Ignavibacteria bacterium]|nr:VOC family protein [Ignavibacteria bacterium]